jgi:hypothetical protein
MSLSSHQSSKVTNDEWLTPPEILEPLGDFDLDPCAPLNMPWDTAMTHYTQDDDGLSLSWFGRVWCNPPFGKESIKWAEKMSRHGNGILLLPARTETRMFFKYVWPVADAICFLRGRPHFYNITGQRAKFNSGAPICLIAYGRYNAIVLSTCNLGKTIDINLKYKKY